MQQQLHPYLKYRREQIAIDLWLETRGMKPRITLADIAFFLGLTRQRVHQIIKKIPPSEVKEINTSSNNN